MNDRIACQSYLFLATYLFKTKCKEKNEILVYIDKANSLCTDRRDKIKIDRLEDQVLQNNIKHGVVKFYNINKQFGLITTERDGEYTFLRKNLKTFFPLDELYKLQGKKVTFKELPNKEAKKYAKSIMIQDGS